MTQAFNLSQFANKVNTSGQANLTTAVTGTLPIANGGTGVTASGTNGNVLTSNGTAWVSQAPPASGFTNMQVFTAPGTFTTPATTTKLKVTVVGGGAGGGTPGASGGGGGGGAAIYVGPVTASTPYAVTVGAAVAVATAGNASSFASLASATGGGVTSPGVPNQGGLGGAGTAGTLQLVGGDGQASFLGTGSVNPSPILTVVLTPSSGMGGSSIFAGMARRTTAGKNYGGGGGGAFSNPNPSPAPAPGGGGAVGVVIVEY